MGIHELESSGDLTEPISTEDLQAILSKAKLPKTLTEGDRQLLQDAITDRTIERMQRKLRRGENENQLKP